MLNIPRDNPDCKPCRLCGHTKKYRDGKCVPCALARSKRYDRLRDHPRNSLHRQLGLDRKAFYHGLEEQGWVCAICQRLPAKGNLDVDHCHKTKKFRGFLCRACNTALGKFQEDVTILKKAIVYLEKSGENDA